MIIRNSQWRPIAALLFGISVSQLPSVALAAGGAFAVDDSEIAKPGQCKVESWASFASNHDAVLSINPACVVSLGLPVELTGQFARTRSSDVWTTTGGIKAKVNIVPVDNGVGIGIEAATNWNLSTRQSFGDAIFVPVSVKLSDTVQLNLNAGWQRDAVAKINYASWGAGVEWSFAPKLVLIGEVFGLVGPRTAGATVTDPRAQIGLRIKPAENVDFDVIYGRNISGENANWITLGVNLRF